MCLRLHQEGVVKWRLILHPWFSFFAIQADLSNDASVTPATQLTGDTGNSTLNAQSKSLAHSISSASTHAPLDAKPREVPSSSQMVKSATTSALTRSGPVRSTAPVPARTRTRNELHEKFKMIRKQVHPEFLGPVAEETRRQTREGSGSDNEGESDDNDNEEENGTKRTHNPELLMEVQTFDPSSLGRVPLVKRNLQPVSCTTSHP